MRPICYLLCLVFLAPFGALAVSALASPDVSAWSLHSVEFESSFRSLACGALVALAATLLGVAAAYQVCFHRFPLRGLLDKALVLPLLFPAFVSAAIYRELFSASGLLVREAGLPNVLTLDIESTAGFVFVMSVSLFPYVYLLARTAFDSLGRSFREVGQSLGLSLARSFTRILLPLSAPAIVIGAGLVFIETVGEWATASLLSLHTSATAIHELWFARGAQDVAAHFAFLLVLVALAVLFPIARRGSVVRVRHLMEAPAGLAPAQSKSEPWHVRWGRFLVCFVPALLGFLIPVSTVALFFVRTLGIMDLSTLLENSLDTIALVAAVTCVGVIFALILSASHRSFRSLLTAFAMRCLTVSYLVPATVIAVACLILANQVVALEHRYDDVVSFWILVLGLSTRFACFVFVPVYVGLSLLSGEAEELGASFGLTRTQTFFRLHLRQIRPFVLLGSLLLIVQVLKETAMSVMLHPFSFQTLVLKAYAYIWIDLLPESSPWIVAILVIGLYPVLTIEAMLFRRGARVR